MFMGLHRRPTYNEVIETLNTNKDLIVKPNRQATQFARTAEYLNLVSESFRDIEQTQLNEMKRKQMEELVRQQTMSNGTDFHQHNTHNRRPGPPLDLPTTEGPEEHDISTPRGEGGGAVGAGLFEAAHETPVATAAATADNTFRGYSQRLGDPTVNRSERTIENPQLTEEQVYHTEK